MEDNINKRMGMAGSERFSNEQPNRNGNLGNTQSINRVGINAGQARLNSALRARKYGETQSMGYVNSTMQNRNNQNVGDTQSVNRYQTQQRSSMQNTQRNNNYSIQDEWSGHENQRVQSYDTQKLNTPMMRQMQQQVNAQSSQSYNQPQDMTQSKQQTVMNDSQTQQTVNKGPQRPGVSSPSMGTMYPVPYNMTPNQDVSARRSAIRTNVIEENNIMAGETRRPQYDNIPLYFDDKKKKFNKKTLIPIGITVVLVAVALLTAVSTFTAGNDSNANSPDTQAEGKEGEKVIITEKNLQRDIVSRYGINAAEATREELTKVDAIVIDDGRVVGDLSEFKYLVALKKLVLKGAGITDQTVAAVSVETFPSLVELDLSDNNTLMDIRFVKNIRSLEKLNVKGTSVTANVIDQIKKANPKLEIEWDEKK